MDINWEWSLSALFWRKKFLPSYFFILVYRIHIVETGWSWAVKSCPRIPFIPLYLSMLLSTQNSSNGERKTLVQIWIYSRPLKNMLTKISLYFRINMTRSVCLTDFKEAVTFTVLYKTFLQESVKSQLNLVSDYKWRSLRMQFWFRFYSQDLKRCFWKEEAHVTSIEENTTMFYLKQAYKAANFFSIVLRN